MSKIKILPQELIVKIAAGEVIERPNSVVKELVENSIDAHAESIDIDIEEGGKRLIRVSDDGEGMSAEDMRLAFTNHATSKIASLDDLFSIKTMGFRGEALPSISSCSQIRVTTRERSADTGTYTEMNGGDVALIEPKAAPYGTCIEVRNLFYNLKPRRSFLKTDSTELSHIMDIITKIALSFPEIGFRVTVDGREAMNLLKGETHRERISGLFGRELAKDLIELRPGITWISGFVSPPWVYRPNSKAVYIAVNKRFIRDSSIQHAVYEAYKGVLIKGRYPVVFVFLALDPGEVDFNVHPAKLEARFRNQSRIYKEVMNSIKERIEGAKLSSEIAASFFKTEGPEKTPVIKENLRMYFNEPPPIASLPPANLEKDFIQIQDLYIVHECKEGLAIIDQHALHERILYTQLSENKKNGTLKRQNLLIPYTMELSKEEASMIISMRDKLYEIGLEVEDFGGNTVAVRSYPAVLGQCEISELVHNILESLLNAGGHNKPDIEDEVLKGMACRGAVMAGKRLSHAEITSLIEGYQRLGNIHTCPHGRPAVVIIKHEDLKKMFKR